LQGVVFAGGGGGYKNTFITFNKKSVIGKTPMHSFGLITIWFDEHCQKYGFFCLACAASLIKKSNYVFLTTFLYRTKD